MNNTKKKVLAGIAAGIMLMGAAAFPVIRNISFGAVSASAKTSGDYEYTESKGAVTITMYNGKASEVSIPEKLDGKTVKAIGEGAFSSNGKLVKVSMPSSVETIGADAFSFCENLSSVSLSGGLKKIDICAFSGCSLKKVSIPAKTEVISEGAFADNKKLTEVVLPDNGLSIETEAFHNCTSLKSVKIPVSVEKIGNMAFGYYDSGEGTLKTVSDFSISCYTNSAAHEYAFDNDLDRELLDPDTVNLVDAVVDGFYIVPDDEKVEDDMSTGSGDVDGDGDVTINDAVMLIASVNGTYTLDERAERAADVDHNASIDISDAVMIMSHINGVSPIETVYLSEFDTPVQEEDDPASGEEISLEDEAEGFETEEISPEYEDYEIIEDHDLADEGIEE